MEELGISGEEGETIYAWNYELITLLFIISPKQAVTFAQTLIVWWAPPCKAPEGRKQEDISIPWTGISLSEIWPVCMFMSCEDEQVKTQASPGF